MKMTGIMKIEDILRHPTAMSAASSRYAPANA